MSEQFPLLNARAVMLKEADATGASLAPIDFELMALLAKLETMKQTVDEQAEDEGLWFVAARASEAYLQQELRQLHAVIEAAI